MESNISHGSEISLEEAISRIQKKVEARGDLPHATVARQLTLLKELAEFPLGQFLLTHQGGLNGYWIHYAFTHPEEKHTRQVGPLESCILSDMPVVIATQERYQIFRKLIQAALKKGSKFASIPSGLMGEFLTLDYTGLDGIEIAGIDLDPHSFEEAKKLARKNGVTAPLTFLQMDAWKIPYQKEFDLISSSGLSIYEKDEEKLLELYRKFFQALKPGGTLVTSFMTYPPNFGAKSEWKIDAISLEAALMQRIVFADLVESIWQAYRSSKETEKMLLKAGFASIKMIYDKAHIFPTVIAVRP
jgi:SAM-dependent methyltransferase